jgi:branched-chain amino acid transport system substrate-binding protein
MTKTTKTIIGLVILIIIVLAIYYGVGKKQTSTTEKEPIKIGAIFALTGQLAKLGEQFKNGVTFAVEEINRQGGINGRKIELIIEDNQSDVKAAVSAFNKLVEIDKVKYVLSFGSAINLALKPIAEEKRVLLFADAAHPKITENAKFIVRHSNIANSDAKVLIEGVKNKKPKSVGIIFVNDDWGVVFNKEFNRLLLEFNPSIKITSESHLPSDTDFRTQLTKILKNNPNTIIIASFGSAPGIIIKQLRELGYDKNIFVNIGFILTTDAQKIAGDAAKGIYYQTMEESKDFENVYMQRYGKKPGLFARYAYTDIEILKYAIEKAGDDPEGVVNFIKNLGKFEGTYENVEINSQGDIIIPTLVKIWE